MKDILKIETNEEHQEYHGIRINEHLINSGNPAVDWIDAQLYCNQNNVVPEIDGSVWYYLLLNGSWESYELDGLHFVVPEHLNKENLQVTEIQSYYRHKKSEQETNPFKNFI